jgi:outer membrane protein TolC
MKRRALYFLLSIILPVTAFSVPAEPDTLSLRACFSACDTLLPFGRRLEAQAMLFSLQSANIRTALLPSVNLYATASYQSDVVSIPINLPGLQIPSPAHDQYALYAELRQPIFDAGVTRARLEMDGVSRNIALNELAISIDQMHRTLAEAWFNLLLIRERKTILQFAGDDLESTRRKVAAASEEGAVKAAALWQVEAAMASYRQQEIELALQEKQISLALSLLTGFSIDTATVLLTDPKWLSIVQEAGPVEFRTAEFRAFELRKLQLDAGISMNKTRRLPVVSAWARAGYGRPGLNMLSDEFNPYFIGGATISWEIWDWKRSGREQEMITLRKADLEAGREIFQHGQEIKRQQLLAEIDAYPGLIQEAMVQIGILEKIVAASAAALDEGNISSDDYLKDFNALLRARIEMHLLSSKQSRAFVNYALLTGIPL